MDSNLNTFSPPEYYNWPFFFTIQKNSETRIKQLTMWADLIMLFSNNCKIWRLSKSQFFNELGKNMKVNR